MVKDSKTTRGPIKISKGGLPRAVPRPRGRSSTPGKTKDARVIMRVHPDLSALIDIRAQENGLNRSAYVERILVAWMQIDPRNQRIDESGIFVPGLVSPYEFKALDPRKFNQRWLKFAEVYEAMFGSPPPATWLDSFVEVVDGGPDEDDPAPEWPRAKK